MSKLKKLTFSAHEWAPFGDAFTRILACVEAPELADHRLYQDCLSGRLETAKLDISPDGSETVTSLNPSDWRQLKVLGGRVAGNFEGGYFFVRRADLDKHYSIAATTTMMAAHQSDDTRPPQRRRGPILKHQWHAIAGRSPAAASIPRPDFWRYRRSSASLPQTCSVGARRDTGRSPQKARCATQ